MLNMIILGKDLLRIMHGEIYINLRCWWKCYIVLINIVVKGDIALKTCGICKQKLANVGCNICSQPRCERCDELWHKHPQRQGHTRHLIIPEELEAPEVQQPLADIGRRHPDANAPQPVIDKTTMRETRLAGGSSPKTPGLFTLPEVSIEETSASSRADDLPDSPKLQHGLELKADVPVVICDFCYDKPGKKFCSSCDDTYCLECDEKRHNNPRRKDHKRQDVTQACIKTLSHKKQT